MKQLLFVITAIFALMNLCGCQSTGTDQEESTGGLEESQEFVDETVDYAMDDGVTIEPETLVDTDDISAQVLGITGSLSSPYIEMEFNRGNCSYLDFDVDYIVVDGWQVAGEIFPPVDSMTVSIRNYSMYYKRFTGQIHISTDLLLEYNLLEELHRIEIGYTMTGDDRYGEIAAGIYSTETSGTGGEIEYTGQGQTLLDEGGIRIRLDAFQPWTNELDEDCAVLLFYMENNSDQRIYVETAASEKYDSSVPPADEEDETRTVISHAEKNGRIVTSVPLSLGVDIVPGARRLAREETGTPVNPITFSDSEVLCFTLNVYDYDGHDTEEDSSLLFSRDFEIMMTESSVQEEAY